MMLSPRSGYHRHSSKYKQALLQLQSKYASIKDVKEKKKLLDNFSDNYLMPMEYWLIRLRNGSNIYREDFHDQHHRKALFQLCHDYQIQGYSTSDMIVYRQTKPPEYSGYDPKATLTYPNPKLRKILMELKEDAMAPFSKETEAGVAAMEALYWKIKEAENDQEQWIKCLQEAENLKFVKRNIEHRLSFNLCNKKLWKLYINYLRESDPQEMLQVYSKYCRFFMDDDEMLEEYKQAVAEHGPVLVKWKNPFRFETQDPNEEYPDNIDRRDDDLMLPDSDYIFEFGSFVAQRQTWSLPNPLIRYIRCTANSITLRKLYHTCKYFFAIHPQILCYQFSFDNTSPDCSSTSFTMKDSILISANSFLPFYQKNLHITTTLKMIHGNSKMLSYVIRKCIYKCTAEFITLYQQELKEYEFKFLVGHGNVEKLELRHTVIKNDNNDDTISLLEMLKFLPNIRSFDVDNLFQSKAIPMLSELKFKNKFLRFITVAHNFVYDPDDFRHFLKDNAAPFSYFRFEFGHECSEEKINELKQDAKRIFENQKIIDGKPQLYIIYES